jgi:Sulfotransferase domain
MIILSIGMPRAGSGWYYNLTNDLMLASGAQDARRIRQRYHLNRILTEINCNIGALTPRRVLAVLIPSLLGNTFVIKAHAGPTPFALRIIRMGWIRPAYIYRDPRDALLSAMENGQRALQRGRTNAFTPLVEFDKALEFMRDYVQIWDDWMRCDQALHARYEDLLTDYDQEAQRLTAFLELAGESPAVRSVIEKYRPEKAQPDQKGLHFSQGKIGRFRQKMSAEHQEKMSEAFGPYLLRMDYPL